MKIAIVTDIFYPTRSSGAVQLLDLAVEFIRHGFEVTVIVPDFNLKQSSQIESKDKIRILRLKSLQTTDMNYISRTKNELLMPFMMQKNFKKSSVANEIFDGIIWYSPTIFLGPFVKFLKSQSNCKSYLIIRDIFPEWALDLGILKKGLLYYFFKKVANYQYSVADAIGVQTKGNLSYFEKWVKLFKRDAHVLHNWLAQPKNVGCSIDISKTKLSNKKIFVYAGNMGIAQGMDILLHLAKSIEYRDDIGFLFVGRGKESNRLKKEAIKLSLKNIVFFDEIDPKEIPGLYAQCSVGLIALDIRHMSHNIPGKFISYMRSGLPVLAHINPNNDLIELIQNAKVGVAGFDGSFENLKFKALELIDNILKDEEITNRCKQLADKMFSPTSTVQQISKSLGIYT